MEDSFRGRMPHTKKKGNQRMKVPNLTALTNRAMRFRNKHGIPDWSPKGAKRQATESGKKAKRVSFKNPESPTARSDSQDNAEEEVEEDLSAAPTTTTSAASLVMSQQQLAVARGREAATNDQRYIHGHETPMIPLFATLNDEHVALLQDFRLTTPQAVIDARSGVEDYPAGVAHGIYLVMRPVDAPRAVDETGSLHQDVASLSPEEVENLRLESEIDPDMVWFHI